MLKRYGVKNRTVFFMQLKRKFIVCKFQVI